MKKKRISAALLRMAVVCSAVFVENTSATSVAEAQTGYTISVTPTNLIVGEEFVVKWTVPLGTFTFDDWFGIFLVAATTGDPLAWKYATFRGGETVFDAPEARGDYECRYFEWSLFGGSRHVAKSETLFVRQSAENPHDTKNYPSRGRSIIAFGDSLVAGTGAAAADEDFPSELGRRLGKEIINAGVSGDTTENALKRLQVDVLDRNPKIVIVLLGGGDILDGKSPIAAVSNLKSIVGRIHEAGACVILVGVQGGLFTDRLRDGLHALAEETRAAYVPNILRGIIANPLLSSDAVHPNREGYKLMAERIFPALLALDATPPVLRLSIARTGATVVVRWEGQESALYRVLASAGLNAASFAPLVVAPERTGNIRSVSLPADLREQFFRVEEVTP